MGTVVLIVLAALSLLYLLRSISSRQAEKQRAEDVLDRWQRLCAESAALRKKIAEKCPQNAEAIKLVDAADQCLHGPVQKPPIIDRPGLPKDPIERAAVFLQEARALVRS